MMLLLHRRYLFIPPMQDVKAAWLRHQSGLGTAASV